MLRSEVPVIVKYPDDVIRSASDRDAGMTRIPTVRLYRRPPAPYNTLLF